MDAAESRSRSGRKNDAGTARLANAARLRALELNLGVEVKRHRDPGAAISMNPFSEGENEAQDKDERTIVKKGF